MAKIDKIVGDTLSIKLWVDTHHRKVVFAEAGKDFVDFLFHIMTLPIGTVIGMFKNNDMLDSVGNLYRSIQNISDVYMESAASKEALLKPKSPSCGASFPLLLPDSSTSACKTYYKCSTEGYHSHRSCCPNVADHPNVTCPICRRVMTQQVVFLETEQKHPEASSSGYVKEPMTYMVMDDLEVKPLSIISCIDIIDRYDTEFGALEGKVVAVGTNEALDLLKTSFYSIYVLTDVFGKY